MACNGQISFQMLIHSEACSVRAQDSQTRTKPKQIVFNQDFNQIWETFHFSRLEVDIVMIAIVVQNLKGPRFLDLLK